MDRMRVMKKGVLPREGDVDTTTAGDEDLSVAMEAVKALFDCGEVRGGR
jgi:hypothetical protein